MGEKSSQFTSIPFQPAPRRFISQAKHGDDDVFFPTKISLDFPKKDVHLKNPPYVMCSARTANRTKKSIFLAILREKP